MSCVLLKNFWLFMVILIILQGINVSVFHWQFLIHDIFSTSLKFEACYITDQWGDSKECYFMFWIRFWNFFVAFHHKICVFIIFISFFSYLPNFRHTILTNQKHDLVASNCQQNCLIPSVCSYLWTPFFKNNHAFYIKFDFWFEKRLFLKYFEISLKIFSKHFLILLVPYILRTSF